MVTKRKKSFGALAFLFVTVVVVTCIYISTSDTTGLDHDLLSHFHINITQDCFHCWDLGGL